MSLIANELIKILPLAGLEKCYDEIKKEGNSDTPTGQKVLVEILMRRSYGNYTENYIG
jgi:hypothetical protein